MKQAMNPYLPLYEYIPDGEPHVFGDRVYIYGSHDRFDGKKFCLNDYVCYSADVKNLKEWRYEGVIYKKTQDPRMKDGRFFPAGFPLSRGSERSSSGLRGEGSWISWSLRWRSRS